MPPPPKPKSCGREEGRKSPELLAGSSDGSVRVTEMAPQPSRKGMARAREEVIAGGTGPHRPLPNRATATPSRRRGHPHPSPQAASAQPQLLQLPPAGADGLLRPGRCGRPPPSRQGVGVQESWVRVMPPPPKPKPCGREEASGRISPELLVGSSDGSVRMAEMSLKPSRKGMPRAREEVITGGTGSSREIPLGNVSNVSVQDREITVAVTEQPRVAAKTRINQTSSPRYSSLCKASSSMSCTLPRAASRLAATSTTSVRSSRESGTRHQSIEKPCTSFTSGERPRWMMKKDSPRLTAKNQADIVSILEAPQKHQAATGKMLQEHRAKEKSSGVSSIAVSKMTVHEDELSASEKKKISEEIAKTKQEVEDAVKQLNELGLGEDISYQELECYLEQLPRSPPSVNTWVEVDGEQLDELRFRNVLYRIKYLKFTRERRKNIEMHTDDLEDDPIYHLEEKLGSLEDELTKLKGFELLDYLDEQGLLSQIQNDELFDWSFHYHAVVSLDDYQRLAPQNYAYEYKDWDTYREYFHSYEIELEYLDYWDELLKELKWMEDCAPKDRSYFVLGKITSRGCYQAIKIASRFSKITESLARGAYHDFLASYGTARYYKDLDGVYFEILQRVTMLKMSFRDALDEVCKLNKFPQQHHIMKDALENDSWSDMEKEFRTCTTGITGTMAENEARKLIADAIKNQKGRPRFYAQYIRNKMEIARVLGLIPI